MQEAARMPVKSRVRVLLAERNLERAKQGLPAISVRQIARETGLTHSALVALVNNQSVMVAYDTLDRLMRFFDLDSLDALLEYIPAQPPGGGEPDAQENPAR